MKAAAWIALALGAGATVWGIHAARLFEQEIWTPIGLQRLAWFAAGYLGVFAAVWLLRPGWFAPLILGCAAVYTMVFAGPAALPPVLLLLFASWLVGRCFLPEDDLLALLAGVSAYTFAAGLAAHLPVNYRAIYVAAMLLPVAARPRDAIACLRRVARLLRPAAPQRRSVEAARALLIAVLVAHWLVALKPEVSADGLAMHLAVPAAVAAEHRWMFDVGRVIWAVMPMNADWAYTLVYLPGGEPAARLLNLGMLLVLVGLLYTAVKERVSGAPAFLIAALFVASPLVQLETGSLMVENFWAALLFGALAACWRYRDTGQAKWAYAAAVLCGTGLATKAGTLALVAPLAVLVLAHKPAGGRTVRLTWLAWFVLFAAPPYLTAWVKTGNPVFPFLNAVFKSPYFQAANFADTRFHERLRWDTLYSMTFHTERFLESQRGGWGFQYLCLLPLTLVLWRRRWPYAARSALFCAAVFFLLTFPYQANLRYLYPALPLFTMGIAAAIEELRKWSSALFRAGVAAVVALALLDFYFLPASGWYHRDFFLVSRGDAAHYRDFWAPVRRIVEYLNAHHPGEPVVFAESNAIAGLRARAYTTTWHTEDFKRRVEAAQSATDCLRLVNSVGTRYFIVPAAATIKQVQLELFLKAFTTAEYRDGGCSLFRIKDGYSDATRVALVEAGLDPVPPGSYDDTSPFIGYSGAWTRDAQFAQAAGGTLTYSNTPGASFRFSFTGSAVTWYYTAALNRGQAEVMLDGANKGAVDLYSAQTRWQARATFAGLGPGKHTLVVRVLDTRSPASSDSYVDVDRLMVGN